MFYILLRFGQMFVFDRNIKIVRDYHRMGYRNYHNRSIFECEISNINLIPIEIV